MTEEQTLAHVFSGHPMGLIPSRQRRPTSSSDQRHDDT